MVFKKNPKPPISEQAKNTEGKNQEKNITLLLGNAIDTESQSKSTLLVSL